MHRRCTPHAYAICLLVLTACAAAPVTQPASDSVFRPDARGLAVPAVGQRIDFGRAPRGVIAALDRELGPHRALDLTGCPAGVIARHRWGDLVLTFGRERFVGWRQGDAAAGQTCA